MLITNPILVWSIVVCAASLCAAASTPFIIPSLTRIWRKATPLGRASFMVAASCALLFGGTKTRLAAPKSMRQTELSGSAVTPEDIACGWQLWEVKTNGAISYAMPADATLATNWWLRGAFEDITPVSNLWAHSWGKVRRTLADTNEFVAVGAPMSAVPFLSRLWSSPGSNGAFRITWENFVAGRATGDDRRLFSAQIEMRANGDYVTRSNDVETVWRRIDPNDFDGDGYLNDDDWRPFTWDDGAELYYGPLDDLLAGSDEDAYCEVTVQVSGERSHWVSFTGDGPSVWPDPQFLAKPDVPYDVKILIGKTYRVECDAPIRAIGRSSDEIVVSGVTTNAFTVVWPVTISQAPQQNDFFKLAVDPPYLRGVIEWNTNACCRPVAVEGGWSYACHDCGCGGCSNDGCFTYEGYSLRFAGISCNCNYQPADGTTFNLHVPGALFMFGAPRPLHIEFEHGDQDEPEDGELTLQVTRGGHRIDIWEDAEMTREASVFSWDVSSFGGCVYYVRGIEKSTAVDDIEFKLVWTRPGGSMTSCTATTTCAEVTRTEVSSPSADVTNGSPNPPPFDGHTPWDFDVTRSPRPDKHYAVLYRDVVDDDFSVRDFSVRMTLVVEPAGARVGTARWVVLEPTPRSGLLVEVGELASELRNPKVGGVYHFASFFTGSPTNECNIVLPLAGAEMSAILASDIAKANVIATSLRAKYSWFERNSISFGRRLLINGGNGDYLGRPDNTRTPSVWYYGMINDTNHLGNVCTLAGIPIRLAKLSNTIAGYTCEKLGVILINQWLSQNVGTRTLTLGHAWQCGRKIANGDDYDTSIRDMVINEWREMDDKTTRPWPNLSPADNWQSRRYYIDFDRRVYSPGFTYETPQ